MTSSRSGVGRASAARTLPCRRLDPLDRHLVETGEAGLHRAQRLLQRLGKARPIAIASPTDFIEVVSSGSAPGNFSKVKRGILVTT